MWGMQQCRRGASLLRRVLAVSPSCQPALVNRPPISDAAWPSTSISRPFSSELPPHEVIGMPALSPTMSSGSIAKWFVKEGDEVAAGSVIADIETDKAVMAMESTEDGYMAKILEQDGPALLDVGHPVAVMVEEESQVAAFADFTGGASPAASTPTSGASDQASPESAPTAPSQGGGGGGSSSPPRLDRLGPAAAYHLAASGLDVETVTPTGPRGIVTKHDVLQAMQGIGLKSGDAAAPAPTPASPPPAPKGDSTPAPASTSGGAAAGPAGGAEVAGARRRRGRARTHEDLPTSQVRRVIARRLLESKTEIPALYMTQACDVGGVGVLRAALKAAGVRVSVNDFVMKAAALALRRVPGVNAGWDAQAGGVQAFAGVDVCVAVATEGGLLTPIVAGADSKSILEISAEVKDLASRAREGKLKPEEFTGGSFSVTNLGMFGVSSFRAIINPPQGAILAVSDVEEVLTLEGGRPTTRSIMNVTLSCDNRVIDEPTAATFLTAFAFLIRNPALILATTDLSDAARES